ncbi:hypothetical protein QVD17_04687 [Tagetes erecta]|uniref:C2 domain-containing protein n=1 Tax=Tagetes erecta TaxID=13708 RepID=A0AAD8LAL6_TARER|nr:hypothetical protein QVD17_04687 [Tagetes erecta]
MITCIEVKAHRSIKQTAADGEIWGNEMRYRRFDLVDEKQRCDVSVCVWDEDDDVMNDGEGCVMLNACAIVDLKWSNVFSWVMWKDSQETSDTRNVHIKSFITDIPTFSGNFALLKPGLQSICIFHTH